MATYNGEKYISEQVNSILCQLNKNDELVIVYDCSKDNTLRILNNINDSRIKIFLNKENKSHVYSFNKAISLASKEILFMADQDDIWIKGRKDIMLQKIIASNKDLLTANANYIDDDGLIINFHLDGHDEKYSNSYLRNTLNIFTGKSNYYGCNMVFTKKLKGIIIPIPNFIESHDLWIAQASQLIRSNIHINTITLLRRVHSSNVSIIKRDFLSKVLSRIIFLISIVILYKRILFSSIRNYFKK
jgi:glycosyltransferase involved in cell wall biosynthesis